MIYPGLVQGWKEYASTSKLTKENGWLDKESQLVFRARANIVEKDPTPLKPEWHEVRFDGRQEYDPGDEFKSPPTWKGNYKFQVVSSPTMSSEALPCMFTYWNREVIFNTESDLVHWTTALNTWVAMIATPGARVPNLKTVP
ncbi:hypothetical protein FOZ62_015912, partial [Perkinsus olseni]